MDGLIEGVTLNTLKRIKNPKGDILHALKCTDEGFFGFGEAYFTQIHSKEIKGWKRHNKMTLNLVVVTGCVKFVIYDDRENSITFGKFEEIILSPEQNYQRLTLAPGLWMAFCGMSDNTSIVMDIIPQPHDDNEGDRINLDAIPYNFI